MIGDEPLVTIDYAGAAQFAAAGTAGVKASGWSAHGLLRGGGERHRPPEQSDSTTSRFLSGWPFKGSRAQRA